jgi:hypothetical protein
VTFDEPIDNVSAADLRLTNLGVNAPAENDVLVDLANASLVSLTTSGNELRMDFASHRLPDGVLRLEVLDSVADLAGNTLDATHLYEGNAQNQFYKLAADWVGNLGVSVFDFSTFSYWFGHSIPVAPAYVDCSSDGGVSVFDFTCYSNNFSREVLFPVLFSRAGTAGGAILADSGLGATDTELRRSRIVTSEVGRPTNDPIWEWSSEANRSFESLQHILIGNEHDLLNLNLEPAAGDGFDSLLPRPDQL